jgi:hypothetical protein
VGIDSPCIHQYIGAMRAMCRQYGVELAASAPAAGTVVASVSSDHNPFNFVEADGITGTIVELRSPSPLVGRKSLSVFR